MPRTPPLFPQVSPFGLAMAAHLERLALTEGALARRCAIHRVTLRDFRTGRRTPRRSHVLAIAAALGLDADQTAELLLAAGLGLREVVAERAVRRWKVVAP